MYLFFSILVDSIVEIGTLSKNGTNLKKIYIYNDSMGSVMGVDCYNCTCLCTWFIFCAIVINMYM